MTMSKAKSQITMTRIKRTKSSWSSRPVGGSRGLTKNSAEAHTRPCIEESTMTQEERLLGA